MAQDNPSVKQDLQRDEAAWSRVAAGLLRTPADVYVVVGYAVLVEGIVTEVVAVQGTVRVLLVLPLVLFLPGYAVLSVLFPARAPHRWFTRRRYSLHGNGLHWADRAALSFGTSVALLPVVGLLLWNAGRGYAPVVTGLATVVVAGMLLGGVRRLKLPRAERYRVPARSWLDELADATVDATSPIDASLNVVLAVLVVAAVGGLVFALVAPPAAESYSEFYLLTENAEGDLVSSGYPAELVRGGETQLYVGIDNNEGQRTTYRVVAEFQRVRVSGTDVTVLDRQRVDAFERTLGPGQSLRASRTVTAPMVGENLRLVYYLYTGDAPANPDAAYRSVYIWVTVVEG